MLEAIGAGSAKRMGGGDWGQKWRDSEEFQVVKREIKQLKDEALAQPDDVNAEAVKEYSTPFMFQLKTILKRTLIAFWRMVSCHCSSRP